jgi:dolichol-phosphate mannosyltransferase
MKKKLYIVIPAYNEEENIEDAVKEWHQIAVKISKDSRLVVVDDGSADKTKEKLQTLSKKYRQLTVLGKTNSGHGQTVLVGYKYAVKQKADYIFMTDSDLQTRSEEFWRFWDLRHDYSTLIGHRSGRQDGFTRVVVAKVLRLVLKLIFGLNIPDANAPFRLMSRYELEKYLKKIPDNFYLPNVILTVLYISGKEKVKFIPITFTPRRRGTGSIHLKQIFEVGLKATIDFSRLKKSIAAS